MASLPYKAIFSSDVFRFIVGAEKKDFFIHLSLVAVQSKSLSTLVNGSMKEAKEGYADWEHWDIQTILRFSEFVYTGDYQEPVVPGRAGQISSTEHNDLLLEPPVEPEPVLRTRKERSSRPCWDSFKRLYPDPQPKSSQNVREEAADFGEVLLSDVDMYVFADYWGIEALESLALRKLHRALLRFNLKADGIAGIIQLVQRCYDKTPNRAETDRLRQLVNKYAALKLEKLWDSQDFRNLVASYGDFVKGLVPDMVGRL